MNSLLPKVCIVSVSLAKGGAERSAAVLSQLLDNLGYDVHVAILTNAIDYAYSGKLYNLGEDKDSTNHPLARFKRFEKFKKYLAHQQIEIVIDHRPKNNYYREVFYAKYLYNGIKRVYVVHNSKKETYFAKPFAKMIKLYKSNFHTVGVSQFITQNLLLSQGILNSSTIHNAHVAEWQNTKCETPESIADLENYILYYGRIENQSKDIQFLLDAYANSQLAKKGFDLIIMGKGPDEEELSNYATGLACKNQIHFLPFQPNPFGIIKKARLVALTSKYEGFPMVLIESLATGIPIVSLDFISGPAEVIQHEKNGLLVKNRSATAFASALERMCFDDALHQTCKQNASASVEAFSADQIAKKWDNLLRSFSK